MLISAGDLKQRYDKFNGFSDDLITRKLSVIENIIREHTNNNFQNRICSPRVTGQLLSSIR